MFVVLVVFCVFVVFGVVVRVFGRIFGVLVRNLSIMRGFVRVSVILGILRVLQASECVFVGFGHVLVRVRVLVVF